MDTTEIINSIQIEVNALRLLCEDLKSRTSNLEKTVIVGQPGSLPLAEVVRNLSNTVSSYIEQKNKEEEEARVKDAQLSKERREQKNRWTILGASIVIPTLLTLLGQAAYFYLKVVPIIAALP